MQSTEAIARPGHCQKPTFEIHVFGILSSAPQVRWMRTRAYSRRSKKTVINGSKTQMTTFDSASRLTGLSRLDLTPFGGVPAGNISSTDDGILLRSKSAADIIDSGTVWFPIANKISRRFHRDVRSHMNNALKAQHVGRSQQLNSPVHIHPLCIEAQISAVNDNLQPLASSLI